MCLLYDVRNGVPGDPPEPLNYRTKGFRDPRRTRSDPNLTPKWSKNGHFWGSEPPDLVRSM